MKRLLFTVVMLMASVSLFTQESFAQEGKDVTKFLGIPIDGIKSEMITKLKEKGFVSKPYSTDVLEGEFNGQSVEVHVVTNNNRVYRIMVVDKIFLNETDIRIRFNTLYTQFKNNPKYVTLGDYTIPGNEDISYQITVNKKRYESVHYQGGIMKSVWFMIDDSYGKYRILIFYDNEYNRAHGEDL